jgi:hypothetical protein
LDPISGGHSLIDIIAGVTVAALMIAMARQVGRIVARQAIHRQVGLALPEPMSV